MQLVDDKMHPLSVLMSFEKKQNQIWFISLNQASRFHDESRDPRVQDRLQSPAVMFRGVANMTKVAPELNVM